MLVDPPPPQAVLKLSMAGTGKDLIFVGALAGNGSGFTPNAATPPGRTMLDLGLGCYTSRPRFKKQSR